MGTELPFFECVYCKVRTLLISAIICLATHLYAQKDYFYAQDLVWDSKHEEALVVLNHLIDSGAYTDRPRFAMATLNLCGTTKIYLKDTIGAMECFEGAMHCYDTLSGPRRDDDWNRREYYNSGNALASIYFSQRNFSKANELVMKIQCPGSYYSETSKEVLAASNNFYYLRSRIFQKLNQPDSAFSCFRMLRDKENFHITRLNEIFDSVVTKIDQVMFVEFHDQFNTLRDTISGYLYCIRGRTNDNETNCQWFINSEEDGLHLIAGSSSTTPRERIFPGSVTQISLSPDQKYLAVKFSDAHETYVDMVRFDMIIHDFTYEVGRCIRPSPASINSICWENSFLCLESDSDLTKLNKNLFLSVSDIFSKKEATNKFLYDPESGKYSRK